MTGRLRSWAVPNHKMQLTRMWIASRVIDAAQLASLLAADSIAARLGKAARSMVPEAEAFLKQ